MERDELKGKQTPGEAIVKENLTWPGNASIPLSMGDECSLISIADAALYAEAHNVANRTGLWPEDMVERIKDLEEALRTLLDNPPSNNPTYTHMPTVQARAILNKK